MNRALCTLAVVVAMFAAPSAGETTVEGAVGGWTEAVVSVRDPDVAADFFRRAGGWSTVVRGQVGRAELDYWRLPSAASARFLKICAPAVEEGCIRFVAFRGVAQRPIRMGARPWDTGGIFSLMIRSNDVQATFADAVAAGWIAESEPYRFAFGQSDLWNVVLTSPQGFNIALYERVSPAFTDYPLTKISRAFNSMRMVRDQRVAVAFYKKLGFSSAFDSDYLDPKPASTNFSIPRNYATKITRRAAAMHPVPSGTGRIELMQFIGFEGKDASSFASPPNLGIISLRFPVRDLATYRAMLIKQDIVIAYAAQRVSVAGLGMVNLLGVRDPDGNITEFYEVVRP